MHSIEVFRHADDVVSYQAGEVIFNVGDAGTTMYAVLDGSVDIVIEGVPVERVELGGFFGEMALIDDSPRSASAIASSDCRLAILDHRQFKKMVAGTPFFAITVMEKMAARLRRANQHHG
jgi:CRP-like cAMP-binding protein